MASHGDPYSRLIAWLKIILPLTALAILSTLFLFSRAIDTTRAIPVAEVDIEQIAREQKIGLPTFSGVAEDGTAFTLSAEKAVPPTTDGQGIRGETLKARLETPTGLRVDILAGAGEYDPQTRRAELRGGVTLKTSSGYLVESETILADIGDRRIYSEGPITASGPIGVLTAGKMVIRQQSATPSEPTYELVFQGGVKLIYHPKK